MSLPRLYTLRDAAAHLGVSIETLRKWVQAKRLTVVRFSPKGPGVRVTEDELRRFVAEATVPAVPPLLVASRRMRAVTR